MLIEKVGRRFALDEKNERRRSRCRRICNIITPKTEASESSERVTERVSDRLSERTRTQNKQTKLKHKQKTCEHAGKAHTSSTRKKHRYLIGPRPRETVSERVEQENKKARRNERVKNKQKTCEHASKAHPQRKKRTYLIIGGRARLYFSGRRKTPTAI